MDKIRGTWQKGIPLGNEYFQQKLKAN